jgi:hypothetical protein
MYSPIFSSRTQTQMVAFPGIFTFLVKYLNAYFTQ